MKLVYILLVGYLASLSLNAQEQLVIEKTFTTQEDKKIELDLKFATDIRITTTDQATTTFKAIILYNEAGMEKVHTIAIEDMEELLSISTDYDFNAHRPTGKSCFGEDHHYHGKMNYCIKVAYELIVPKDATVRLETISGNIEVTNFTGDLKAKTISGFVDVALPPSHPTRLKFKSVTGEIYTDFEVALHKNSTAYSKKLATSINGGGDQLLALETISGDIFFRKL